MPKPQKSAPAEEWAAFGAACKAQNLNAHAVRLLHQMRGESDVRHNAANRTLPTGVDGSYTNKTVLRGLPQRTTLVGRIREDAKLFHPPDDADRPTVLRRGDPHLYMTVSREHIRTGGCFKQHSLGASGQPDRSCLHLNRQCNRVHKCRACRTGRHRLRRANVDRLGRSKDPRLAIHLRGSGVQLWVPYLGTDWRRMSCSSQRGRSACSPSRAGPS